MTIFRLKIVHLVSKLIFKSFYVCAYYAATKRPHITKTLRSKSLLTPFRSDSPY